MERQFYPLNMDLFGGDELNIVLQGESYGWPSSAYGFTYGLKETSMNLITMQNMKAISSSHHLSE